MRGLQFDGVRLKSREKEQLGSLVHWAISRDSSFNRFNSTMNVRHIVSSFQCEKTREEYMLVIELVVLKEKLADQHLFLSMMKFKFSNYQQKQYSAKIPIITIWL